MQEESYPQWFRTFLRTYGAMHIIVILFLVFSTLWVGQEANQFLVAVYFLAALTGTAALLLKPWGAYPAMALAALITFLLLVINMFVHPPMFTEWGVYYIRFLSLAVILLEWITSLIWWHYRPGKGPSQFAPGKTQAKSPLNNGRK